MREKKNSFFSIQKNKKNLDGNFFIDQRISVTLFKELKKELEKSQKKLEKFYKESEDLKLTESEKIGLIWFSENYHYFEDIGATLRDVLDSKGFAYLPITDKSDPKIRAIELVKGFVFSKKRLSPAALSLYINSFQKNSVLTLAELWFLPTAFQIVSTMEMDKMLSGLFFKKAPKAQKIDREIKHLVLMVIAINKINWKKLVEGVSSVEAILAKDPAKIYKKMDFKTRDSYRHIIEDVSKRTGVSEIEVAEHSLQVAKKESKHIGFYLAGPEKERTENFFGYRASLKERIRRSIANTSGAYMFFFLIVLSLFFTGIVLEKIDHSFFSILSFLVFILVLVGVEVFLNRLIIRIFPPQAIYKLNYKEGVPLDRRTLVVVPTLLTENSNDPASLLENIELNYLSNRDKNIFYGLLLSFPEIKGEKDIPTKKESENLSTLIEGINVLNKKYQDKKDPFLLFFRKRQWSQCQGMCLEWERKRGKIIELLRLLRGGGTEGFHTIIGDDDVLKSFRYVITLDRGELMARGAAKNLIAAMSHPLNEPIVDPEKRIVTHGYGIIQPTMASTNVGGRSLFSKIFSGNGWDSYSGLSSNVYQDLFLEGAYFGKGVFDINVFNEVIDGRFLEDRILSHDLIEGFYCRTGYASDIQIFEEEPQAYISFARRKERWVRGDWQNFFWLFGKIKREKGATKENNPLFLHHKWKILNNLLRSLVFPFAFFTLLYGWFFLEGSAQMLLTIVVLLSLNAESLASLINVVPSRRLIKAWKYYFKVFIGGIFKIFLDFLFKLLFSLHLGILSLEAIMKALYRVVISRKKTLEWQAYHQTKKAKNNSFYAIFRFTLISQVFAGLFLLFYTTTQEVDFIPFAIMSFWFLVPIFAYLFSYGFNKKSYVASINDQKRLRLIALKTWRFFEETVSEKTNYLPPDNFLEVGSGKKSSMTSITNIGMYLLSAKAANDLGYIDMKKFLFRVNLTLKTVKDLDTFKGHFFNWYDINSKNSLSPRYISTVDSGNFAACLLVLKRAILELYTEPIKNFSIMDSVDDYLVMLLRAHDESSLLKADERELKDALEDIRSLYLDNSVDSIQDQFLLLGELSKKISSLALRYSSYKKSQKKKNIDYWLLKTESLIRDRLKHLESLFPVLVEKSISPELDNWLKDLFREESIESLNTATKIKLKKADNLSVKEDILLARDLLRRSENYIKDIKALSDFSLEIISLSIDRMDFDFLYDEDQELFKIGYNKDKNKYDKSCYDLLASEARLASVIALSKGDLSLDHWNKLGRPLAHYKGELVLLSWGGSLFEYLFSQMLLPTAPNSLIDKAEESAINMHIGYAKKNNIPWGISESSYVQKSRQRDYLYKMHGIPALGLRRLLRKDLVVAPYATFLALRKKPKEAIENIKKLQQSGFENKYGLYEAIDYSRNPDGEVAKVYMAHHQGSIIVSITNFLMNRPFENRFMENIEIKAINYILGEGVSLRGRLREAFDIKKARSTSIIRTGLKNSKEENHLSNPIYHIISNGRLTSFLSSTGGSALECENTSLIPLGADKTLNDFGFHIYLKDNRTGIVWSTGYRPTLLGPESYKVSIGDNYFKQARLDGGVLTELESFLHPKVNAEIKALTLTNKSQQRKSLSVSSYGEVCLFPLADYRAHPNFQKLKILLHSTYSNGFSFKKTERRGEHAPLFSHLLIQENSREKIDLLSERAAFFGDGDMKSPMAIVFDRFPRPKNGFDKIFAAKKTLTLMPFEKKTFFYANLYVGKEERLENSIKETSDFKTLYSMLEVVRKSSQELVFAGCTVQKLITVLMLGRGHSKNSQYEEKAKGVLSINWDIPTVLIEIKEIFSKTLVKDALEIFYMISKKGLKYNLIIVAHEKDEYSKKTVGFVEKTLTSIEGGQKSKAFSYLEKINIINASGLDSEAKKGLIDLSSFYFDISKKPIQGLVDQEFRKI